MGLCPAEDNEQEYGCQDCHYDRGAALQAVPELVSFSHEKRQVIHDPALGSMALGQLSP